MTASGLAGFTWAAAGAAALVLVRARALARRRRDGGGRPVTIVGYGSLLSPTSARLTFPQLREFRLVRLHGFRRVFGHPNTFLLRSRHVARDDLRCSSLSIEPCPGASLVAAAFTVDMSECQWRAFCEREEEYKIARLPLHAASSRTQVDTPVGEGIACIHSTDAELAPGLLEDLALPTLWHWAPDSGLRPATVYLRHCLLAARAMGCEDSFLDETWLVDRKTSLREYIAQTGVDSVLNCHVPPALQSRYGG
jgi:hypothetical protein